MTDALQIVVKEFKRRGRFDMYLDGRYLGRSTTPLLTAARILLAEGLPPETAIEMRHQGSTAISLRSTIDVAAKLGVGKERFGEYGSNKAPDSPEDEEIEVEAVYPPRRRNDAMGEAVGTPEAPPVAVEGATATSEPEAGETA